MIETAKIIQAACYILGHIGKADKLKLVKLIYLADKCHLIRYGRTATGDKYWAMPYGPVGSATKDVLTFDEEYTSNETEYISKMLKKAGKHDFKAKVACRPEELDYLSESDIEVLDLVIDVFGRKTTSELIAFTHRYPEWSQYKHLFDEKQTKRETINPDEVLSTIPEDPFKVPQEHIEESRRILTGTFD